MASEEENDSPHMALDLGLYTLYGSVNTLFRAVAANGDYDTTRKLLSHPELRIESTDGHGRTALHQAASVLDARIMKLLLTRGADANRQTLAEHGKQTALHMVLDHSSDCPTDAPPSLFECVSVLVQYGASVDALCSKSQSALHRAAFAACDHKSIELLMQNSRQGLRTSDCNQNLPLHLAVRNRKHHLVHAILRRSRGFGVNKKNGRGETPLFLVIWGSGALTDIEMISRSISIIEGLFKYGADIQQELRVAGCLHSLFMDALGDRMVHHLLRILIMEQKRKTEARQAFKCLVREDIGNSQSTARLVADIFSGDFDQFHQGSDLRWVHFPACNLSWIEILYRQLFNKEVMPDCQLEPDEFSSWLTSIKSNSAAGNHPTLRPQLDVKTSSTNGQIWFLTIPFLRLEDYLLQNAYDEASSRLSTDGARGADPYLVSDFLDWSAKHHGIGLKKFCDLMSAEPDYQDYGRVYTLDASHHFPWRTADRDMSQVFLRAGQDVHIESNELDIFRSSWWPINSENDGRKVSGRVVVVDTVFICVIGNTVISCFNESMGITGWSLKDNISAKLDRVQTKTTYALADIIVQECTSCVALGKDEVFGKFRLAIGMTTTWQTKQFKTFVSALIEFERLAKSTTINTQEMRQAVDDISNTEAAIKNMCEVFDIIEELEIMRGILAQQLTVIGDFNQKIGYIPNARALATIEMISRSCSSIEKMVSDAKRTHEDIQQLLDLKQKQATIMESRFARWQAESAAQQGNTVMVFTIATVIFLPATFVTTFFAIPNINIPGMTEGGFGLVIGVIIALTVLVSAPLILLAFNLTRLKEATSKLRVVTPSFDLFKDQYKDKSKAGRALQKIGAV